MTPELFPHGIFEENSDVRAHVSVLEKIIYVFPTRNGINAIKVHDPVLKSAGQPGVDGPTATGWLVRPDWIEDIRKVKFLSWERWGEFNEDLPTNKKGKLAVECVIEIMRRGRFPFWIDATEDQRENIQISGTDILVFCKKRVQVKCDYPIGKTGNLFLQKAERNPLKRH
jgi:hypothetical protein